ncbi:uncharacterized protein LOC121866592 [Homarus americanus]|nr:uncharacterized protein LOC121866592 [Homarus americanus]
MQTTTTIAMMMVVVVVVVVGASEALPAKTPRKQSLENAFSDRATVEAIIDCFLNKKTCNEEEKAIKVRAMATMRNLGTCPLTLCTPQEQQDMTRSMELLEMKHPDLWGRLIASMIQSILFQ